VIGATLAPSFKSFVAFRSLQGLFGTIPQVIGLPIIHDMYSPEGRQLSSTHYQPPPPKSRKSLADLLADWPKMINIWGTTFLVGPFLGPALAGYLSAATSWRGAFAVLVALYAVSTALVLSFGRETYYLPNTPIAKGPNFIESLTARGGALAVQRPSFTITTKTLIKYLFRLPLLLVGAY